MGRHSKKAPKHYVRTPHVSQSNSPDEDADDQDGRHTKCSHNGCSYCTNRVINLMRLVNGNHVQLAKPQVSCSQEFRDWMLRTAAGASPLCKCAECVGFFPRRRLLARHMSVHNDVRAFACGHCKYSSSHKYNVERHRAAEHGIGKRKSSDKDSRFRSGGSGHSSASSGETVDKAIDLSTSAGIGPSLHRPLRRRGPYRPNRSLVWEQQLRKALIAALSQKPRPIANGGWHVSPADLQEAGPSAIHRAELVASATTPEPPPATWQNAEVETSEERGGNEEGGHGR